MRHVVTVIAVVSAVCARAHAEPIAAPAVVAARVSVSMPAEDPGGRFALTVSGPTSWLIGALGASAYVRLGGHVTLRANIARYQSNGPAGPVAAALSGSGTGYGGSIFDLGVSAILYPKGAWQGLFLEAGVLRRARDVYVWPEFEEKTFTNSTEVGGRALIGWSWLIGEHVVIAIAAGGSSGRESGHSTTTDYRGTAMTTPVHRRVKETEGYTRVGWVF